MNDIIEEHYIRYFECLNTNDKDICNKMYLNIRSRRILAEQYNNP